MEEAEQYRIEQLEKLISHLRHDLRGLVTPALLVAERLELNGDPTIQRSGMMITGVVERIITTLDSTYDVVPPRGKSGPLTGAGGQLD